MTRDTGDLLQNMLPSGGWGSFLLLKDPISLTREHQSYETKREIMLHLLILTKIVSMLLSLTQWARILSLVGSTLPSV